MTAPETSTDRIAWLRAALDAHERPLLRYAARLLGGDEDRAREVVQETFLRLWRADRGEVDQRLPEWLFTVCRNCALDIRRREDRMTPLDLHTTPHPPSPAPAAPEQLEHHQTLALAMQALERLPPNQQEVIRLKFQEGLAYKEISAITGLSTSNVGYLIHTGMKTLRSLLLDEPGAALAAPRRTP